MPPGDGVNVLFDGRSVNFHYYDPTGAPTLFHGVPTADHEWQKLDLWSVKTGNNDGYDYIMSDSSVYEVLRHDLSSSAVCYGLSKHKHGFKFPSCTY